MKTEKQKEWMRNYMREYNKRPYVRERMKKYNHSAKALETKKLYSMSEKAKESARRYWLSERGKQRKRESLKKMRIRCLEAYGNKCACCGEDKYEFLSFDHINGGGTKHRKEVKYGEIFRWLHKNSFPEGFRILCHNCNQSLGAYGYCPHKFIPNGYDIKTGEYVYVHAE